MKKISISLVEGEERGLDDCIWIIKLDSVLLKGISEEKCPHLISCNVYAESFLLKSLSMLQPMMWWSLLLKPHKPAGDTTLSLSLTIKGM